MVVVEPFLAACLYLSAQSGDGKPYSFPNTTPLRMPSGAKSWRAVILYRKNTSYPNPFEEN
jgi:hypothetical protein